MEKTKSGFFKTLCQISTEKKTKFSKIEGEDYSSSRGRITPELDGNNRLRQLDLTLINDNNDSQLHVCIKCI